MTDRVERKAALTGDVREELGPAICAFANELAGYGRAGLAMIGVDDAGRATGLPITDTLLRTLWGSTETTPHPAVTRSRRRTIGDSIATICPARRPGAQCRGRPSSFQGDAVAVGPFGFGGPR